MSDNAEKSELQMNIEKHNMVPLLLDYEYRQRHQLHKINAARRKSIPVVADRVSACRYCVENFDSEIIDVVISSVASAVMEFGVWQAPENGDGEPVLANPVSLPVDFILDNFDYSDLLRINALMGKGVEHPFKPEAIKTMVSTHDIVPLHQTYQMNGMTFNAAFRQRRPVVRDHVQARGFSVERWGHSFTDIIMAGTAASTLKFGTFAHENDHPVVTNQCEVPLEYLVDNLIYPDLLLLNRLLVKTPASSASGAKR
ncbi:hypothetical protein OVA10_03435 [Lelliottia sp. SL45]|uniref:hypothetical protein n=1 Tax=Lelliottia sp. SL45 TaxID=2994665 RepID=UPI00227506D4|nr:hypothetical protein [Lelliottia sp. SL45]MCY1697141.1 hypothetical protein [Lelliottia sp. SL45]